VKQLGQSVSRVKKKTTNAYMTLGFTVDCCNLERFKLSHDMD